MTLSKNRRQVMEMLTRVTKTGVAEEFKYPGTSDRIAYDAFYFLKASLSRKLESVWRAGRAGFAYTSWPKPGQEVMGIWVCPDLGTAVTKRDEMVAEGWTVKLISWTE